MGEKYENLQIWERTVDFASAIYTLTSAFPPEEKYGLTNQLRRASVSVASNIAEGATRSSNKEFAHFIIISVGSLAEIKTQLIIAAKIGHVDELALEKHKKEIDECTRMLYALRTSLTHSTNHALQSTN